MENYKKLLKFLKGHESLFGLAIFFMVLASIFEGVQLPLAVPLIDRIFTNKPIVVPNELPQFAMNLVDWLNGLDSKTLFKYFPIVALVLIFTKQFLIFCYKYLMNNVSQSVLRDVRLQVYSKIQHLSLDYFSDKRTGELISRITNDVQVVENAVSYSLTDLFRQTFVILINVVLAFTIYPKAAFIIFIIFPAIGYPLSLIGKRLRKISKSTQEKMADINSLLLETISGVKVVKAFRAEDYEINRFREKNNDFYKLRMKSIKRILYISPLTELFGAVMAMAVIFWLGKDVLEGKMSLGAFTVFFGAIMMLISPVKKLGNVNVSVQQALAANDRIYEILNEEQTVKEASQAKDIGELKDSIVFDNVSFGYSKSPDMILKGVNVEIKKGELVAIVGPTGTGKTTLVNLIPRFYDPSEGRILMDGVDLKEATFESLRDQMGIVTQESILFNDTVKANIAYGHQGATQEEIECAAKQAFAHKFIDSMSEKYDTVIGDRGFRLSGGEKQRISIARAILKNAPILILDEATSQLDSESEKFVQEAVDKLMEGRTVVAIAHRLSTIVKADKIIVIQGGSIVGQGVHKELLETCSLYKKLYTHQFEAVDNM
jgi:subfamily B ATP-binding cassette protein MsbA